MAAKHEQTYTIYANIEQLCALVKDPRFSLELRLEFKSENPIPNGIWYRFHHGVSFTSWGEKITITFVSVDTATTLVTIHSECGMPTQVVDWGKNKKVVNNIFDFINKNLGYFSAPQPTPRIIPQTVVSEPSKSAFCTNCGKPVPECAKFCGSCGARLG